MFVDDLMMLVETKEALQHNLQELNDRLDEWGIKANWQKMRVMRVGRKHEVCNVKVKSERVEQVNEMKYLGTMIISDGSMDSEVEERVGMASRIVGELKAQCWEGRT